MSSPLFVYANLTIDRSDPVQVEIWLKSAMIRNFRNVNQNMILLDFPYNPVLHENLLSAYTPSRLYEKLISDV